MISLLPIAFISLIYFATLRPVYLAGGYLKTLVKVRMRVKIYTLIGFSLLPRFTYWIYLGLVVNVLSVLIFYKMYEEPTLLFALLISLIAFVLGVKNRPVRYSYVQDRVHDDIARGKRSRGELNILDSALKQLRLEREQARRKKTRAPFPKKNSD